ncbi:MAG: sulfotransferase family 2 domain-containing protein [Pseudomonadota bacterium]
MAISLMDDRITYVSAPKCACSALKMYFFHVEHGRPWRPYRRLGRKVSIHRVYPSRPFTAGLTRAAAEHFRIAVVRDPVARLVSTFVNKVASGLLAANAFVRAALAALGASARPGFEEFVARLGLYRRVSPMIDQHARPMVDFLGSDAGWYDHIVDISDIDTIDAVVRARVTRGSLPARIHRKNESAAGDKPAVAPDLRARITGLYKADVDAFGHIYKPALQPASA